jgi:hypothetical protein
MPNQQTKLLSYEINFKIHLKFNKSLETQEWT